MRMERGQKSKVSRFQGQNAPQSKMQEISKELKWILWKHSIDRMKATLRRGPWDETLSFLRKFKVAAFSAGNAVCR
jgi:hypothetical protein